MAERNGASVASHWQLLLAPEAYQRVVQLCPVAAPLLRTALDHYSAHATFAEASSGGANSSQQRAGGDNVRKLVLSAAAACVLEVTGHYLVPPDPSTPQT